MPTPLVKMQEGRTVVRQSALPRELFSYVKRGNANHADLAIYPDLAIYVDLPP